MNRYAFRCLAVGLVLGTLLSGCSQVNPNETIHSEPHTEPTRDTLSTFDLLDVYFDMDQKHYPAEQDIVKVTMYMPIQKVVEIIGKPHDFGPTSGVPSLSWVTDSGNEYYFCAMVSDTIEKPDYFDQLPFIEQLMEYGVIISDPKLIGESTN
jgi:hypothetical protein